MPDPRIPTSRLPDGGRNARSLGPFDTERSGASTATAQPAVGGDRLRRPFRDRTSKDAWSAVAVLVAVVLFVVPAGILLQQSADQTTAAARQAAGYAPPPVATPTPAAGPVVAVLADETADRSSAGVTVSKRWPALLASQLRSQVTTIAADGGGYATSGSSRRTFVGAAESVPVDAQVVLVVGGANDGAASGDTLAGAATQVVAAVHKRAPGAAVALVGPVVTNGFSSATLATLRSTLSVAAASAGAKWVDPVASKWLTAPARAGDLTASDERTIASKLAAIVTGLQP
ncbi:GDSL-type esterase/lipase family protein [Amnibacterium sp.]|uniref:GDSL-type esterase/lipase family protein n=1 Tax=Amnibacterium sp. TaxID=1872496 RepID=UPI003F7C5DFA